MAEGGELEMENVISGNDNDTDPIFIQPKDDDYDNDSDHLSLEGKKGAKKYRWKKHDYDSDDEEETSFGGGVVNLKNKIINNLKSRFPDIEYKKLDIAESDDGSLGVRDKLTNKFTTVINSAGEIAKRIPDRLRKLLGESFHTKLQRNARLNDEAVAEQNILSQENEEDQNNYDEETDNMDPTFRSGNEIQKRIVARNEQISRIQDEINKRNREDMNTIDRLPIRERVREIFKKYGFTIASIMLAIWAVVATIIGATKSGRVKKEITQIKTTPMIKLNKSIPTRTIVNFILDAAMDVIDDLVEN